MPSTGTVEQSIYGTMKSFW